MERVFDDRFKPLLIPKSLEPASNVHEEGEASWVCEVVILDDKTRTMQGTQLANIITRLDAVFGNEEQYRALLKCPRSDRQIQTLLDLFKQVRFTQSNSHIINLDNAAAGRFDA